jgi:CBS domain-containing protein
VILKGRASRDTLVGEIMGDDVIMVPSALSVEASLVVMTDHYIRHLLIVDNDSVIGVVSIGDLIKDVISDQRTTIDALQSYIRG